MVTDRNVLLIRLEVLLGRPLHKIARKAFLIAGVAVMASVAARAQTADPLGDLIASVNKSTPLDTPAPAHALSHALSDRDVTLFRQAIEAARRANVNEARSAIAEMADPLARKTATWVLVDSAADSLGFYDVDNARRELAGWPRGARRQAAAERLLETAGKTRRRARHRPGRHGAGQRLPRPRPDRGRNGPDQALVARS